MYSRPALYRRSLKAFLVYCVLGFLGLRLRGSLLGFRPVASSFWNTFPDGHILLAPAVMATPLPGPVAAGAARPGLGPAAGRDADPAGVGAVLACRYYPADLLGFQNLAIYVARGLILDPPGRHPALAPVAGGGDGSAPRAAPEVGWAPQRYPEQQVLLQRLYATGRWVLSILLGAGIVLWFLYSWGIKPGRIAWAFQWVAWGPRPGPGAPDPTPRGRRLAGH